MVVYSASAYRIHIRYVRLYTLYKFVHTILELIRYERILMRTLENQFFKILAKNILEIDGEIYHFEESHYCLKLKNFDVYTNLIKHQDSPSNFRMKLHTQLDPK